MFMSQVRAMLLGIFVGGVGVLGFSDAAAQQPDQDKKPADPKNAADKKKEVKPKPTDPMEITELKDKLKKYESEIAKIRQAMLKDLAVEEKKVSDAIAKAKKDKAMKQLHEAQSQKIKLAHLRHDIEHRIKVGQQPNPRRAVPAEQQLGIHTSQPNSALRAQLGLAKNQGLIVDKVTADSAAAKAGLKPHDVLVQVHGKPVPSDVKEFRKVIADAKTESVDVVIIRQGKQETIKGLKLPAGE